MDYDARVPDVMRLACDVAKELNALLPSARKTGSDVLALAWWKQLQAEAAEYPNKRQVAIARKLAESSGCNPDEVVAGHSGPASICKIPTGEVVAVGSMVGGCCPLWVHYVDTAGEVA